MNYINQLNYPDLIYITRTKLEGADRGSGQTTTIKSSGCGLCCAVMVAKNLIPDCNFEIEDAIKLSYESEANAYIGTNYKFFAPAFSQKFNLEYESTCDIERLKDWLGSGGIAVANVGGDREGYTGVFSKKGHYITVINLENGASFDLVDGEPSITWLQDGEKATLNGQPYAYGAPITEAGEYTLTVTAGDKSASVSFTVTDTRVTYIKGDFDYDEEITVADALAALRIAARMAEYNETDILIGDIDSDGEITVADALAILRVAAKMADSL